MKTFREDLDFQCLFFEKLAKKLPEDITILTRLGELYCSADRLQESIHVDLRICDLDPRNPFAHYNLACSLARDGKFDLALEHLQTALELGFQDVLWIEKDPDLVDLHSRPEFILLLQQFKN